MKLNIANFKATTSPEIGSTQQLVAIDTDSLMRLLHQEIQGQVKSSVANIQAVAQRIATEVERICRKSSRIQTSGQIQSWQTTLAKHRLQKCLHYYQLGSKQGRVELHSTLGGMVYRHIAPAGTQLGFQGRYTIIEDFLQAFYIEAIKAFRRENEVQADYSPRTQLELAEYMAFTEQYAKRRINLPGTFNQQLIVLRAQSFARRQPPETTVDIEMAVESARSEEAETHQRSAAVQQVRAQMMSMPADPGEQCDRERIISELVQYLESEGQSDCVDYLMLKLKDFSAPEIDQMLGLTSRERDYLQQRFKYHMEKFSRTHQWQLVHQWLGADLEHKLGLSSLQWEGFVSQLSAEQQQMLHLKRAKNSDQAIAKKLKCTPKQLQKRWTQLLAEAWSIRNGCIEQQAG